MATDDGAETCLAWIKVELHYIVQDIDQEIAKLDDFRFWKIIGPFTRVDVPPNGNDRSDGFQRFNYLWASYVPGMYQKVCPLESP